MFGQVQPLPPAQDRAVKTKCPCPPARPTESGSRGAAARTIFYRQSVNSSQQSTAVNSSQQQTAVNSSETSEQLHSAQ